MNFVLYIENWKLYIILKYIYILLAYKLWMLAFFFKCIVSLCNLENLQIGEKMKDLKSNTIMLVYDIHIKRYVGGIHLLIDHFHE
jgi:hypothetical protein